MISYAKLRKLNVEIETARSTEDDLNSRIEADDVVSYSDLSTTPTQLKQIYYQATGPSHSDSGCTQSTVTSGDYWIDSDDNKLYISDGSTWSDIQDNDVGAGADAKALTDIAFDENGNLITSVLPASNVTPSGAGLYMGADYLGYFASGTWQTYMDSSGNFYLGGTSGKLQWNGSVLGIDGSIDITGTSTVKQLLQIHSLGTLRTNTTGSYPYIELSNSGMQLKDSDDGSTYATGVYSTAKYGFGATVWIMNSQYEIPWMEVKEPVDGSANDMPSFRLYNRSANPTGGTYATGDLCVVGGKLMIYNAGWVIVGTQT